MPNPAEETPVAPAAPVLTPPRAGLPLPIMIFLGFQVVLAASGIGWATYRVHQIDAEHVLPIPLNEPLEVLPRFDEPAVASDEQLVRALEKLRPRLRGDKPKMNYVDHALRFWGIEARFDAETCPNCLSGMELRDLLLDHRQFEAAWGAKTRPFMLTGPQGIRPRLQEGEATASHVDHTLATLAEVGTPLDTPVMTARRETDVRALLEQSLRDFSLNQTEYEWSALAYALYLPTRTSWYSREGQRINFDVLAERIMRQALPQGVCLGNHRMHALVMLLRVHEQQPILSEPTREAVTAFLKGVTQRFIEHQHEEGYWDRGWTGPTEPAMTELHGPPDPLSNRVLATGHVMEWWALAPAEIHPPLDVLARAGQWLCTTIETMTDREIDVNYTYLSHAGRALALWRGKLPAQVKLESAVAPAAAAK